MEAPPPPPPLLFNYADVEAMQNAEGVFVANFVVLFFRRRDTIHVLD